MPACASHRRPAPLVALGVVAAVSLLAGPGAREAAGTPEAPARDQVAAGRDLGGLSGVVDTDASTENLCVLARPVDGRSPAVKTRTFQVPGVVHAVFAIGVLPGDGIPAGTWTLRGLPCDGSATAPATPRFGLRDVRVTGGEVSAGLRLTAARDAAGIAGTVVDGEQEPVAGACITAVGLGEGTTGGATTAAEDGTYQLGGFPSGDYRVVGEGCGTDEAAAGLRGAAVDDKGSARTIAATDAGAEGVTVVMGEGRRVRGRLVDDQGGGVGGVCVAAGDRATVSEDDGRFEMRGVATEVRSLAVNACGEGQGVVAEQVNLPGGTADLGRVEVRRAGTVQGDVRDGDGLPASGVRVSVRRKTGGPDIASAITGTLGSYAITGLPPGRYVVVVNPDGRRGLPTVWATADGVAPEAGSAEPRRVGTDAPVPVSAVLGEPTPTTNVAISATPVDDAAITVAGVRRGDGPVTVPLPAGDNLIEFGDVTGFATPDNVVVEGSSKKGGKAPEVTGTYVGPFVRLTAEVPANASPVEIYGRPVGSGRVVVLVAPDELVEVCAAGRCLPTARAADLQGQVLRPPVSKVPDGPRVRAIALGANATVLDAEVTLDGDVRAVGQVLLPVDAGETTVKFGDVPGYLTPLPHRIDVGADEEIPVVARYLRLAQSTVDTGTEDAPVWIDGVAVGTGTVSIGLQPGTRRVCARLEDGTACKAVEVSGGRGLHLDARDLAGG